MKLTCHTSFVDTSCRFEETNSLHAWTEYSLTVVSEKFRDFGGELAFVDVTSTDGSVTYATCGLYPDPTGTYGNRRFGTLVLTGEGLRTAFLERCAEVGSDYGPVVGSVHFIVRTHPSRTMIVDCDVPIVLSEVPSSMTVAGSMFIDDVLSLSSVNAVQNRVVYSAVSGMATRADTRSVDDMVRDLLRELATLNATVTSNVYPTMSGLKLYADTFISAALEDKLRYVKEMVGLAVSGSMEAHGTSELSHVDFRDGVANSVDRQFAMSHFADTDVHMDPGAAESMRDVYGLVVDHCRGMEYELHVTDDERNAWNSSFTSSFAVNHVGNSAIHLTEAVRSVAEGLRAGFSRHAADCDTYIVGGLHHVSQADREAWSGVGPAVIVHADDDDIHVTTADRDNWSSMVVELPLHVGSDDVHLSRELHAGMTDYMRKFDAHLAATNPHRVTCDMIDAVPSPDVRELADSVRQTSLDVSDLVDPEYDVMLRFMGSLDYPSDLPISTARVGDAWRVEHGTTWTDETGQSQDVSSLYVYDDTRTWKRTGGAASADLSRLAVWTDVDGDLQNAIGFHDVAGDVHERRFAFYREEVDGGIGQIYLDLLHSLANLADADRFFNHGSNAYAHNISSALGNFVELSDGYTIDGTQVSGEALTPGNYISKYSGHEVPGPLDYSQPVSYRPVDVYSVAEAEAYVSTMASEWAENANALISANPVATAVRLRAVIHSSADSEVRAILAALATGNYLEYTNRIVGDPPAGPAITGDAYVVYGTATMYVYDPRAGWHRVGFSVDESTVMKYADQMSDSILYDRWYDGIGNYQSVGHNVNSLAHSDTGWMAKLRELRKTLADRWVGLTIKDLADRVKALSQLSEIEDRVEAVKALDSSLLQSRVAQGRWMRLVYTKGSVSFDGDRDEVSSEGLSLTHELKLNPDAAGVDYDEVTPDGWLKRGGSYLLKPGFSSWQVDPNTGYVTDPTMKDPLDDYAVGPDGSYIQARINKYVLTPSGEFESNGYRFTINGVPVNASAYTALKANLSWRPVSGDVPSSILYNEAYDSLSDALISARLMVDADACLKYSKNAAAEWQHVKNVRDLLNIRDLLVEAIPPDQQGTRQLLETGEWHPNPYIAGTLAVEVPGAENIEDTVIPDVSSLSPIRLGPGVDSSNVYHSEPVVLYVDPGPQIDEDRIRTASPVMPLAFDGHRSIVTEGYDVNVGQFNLTSTPTSVRPTYVFDAGRWYRRGNITFDYVFSFVKDEIREYTKKEFSVDFFEPRIVKGNPTPPTIIPQEIRAGNGFYWYTAVVAMVPEFDDPYGMITIGHFKRFGSAFGLILKFKIGPSGPYDIEWTVFDVMGLPYMTQDDLRFGIYSGNTAELYYASRFHRVRDPEAVARQSANGTMVVHPELSDDGTMYLVLSNFYYLGFSQSITTDETGDPEHQYRFGSIMERTTPDEPAYDVLGVSHENLYSIITARAYSPDASAVKTWWPCQSNFRIRVFPARFVSSGTTKFKTFQTVGLAPVNVNYLLWAEHRMWNYIVDSMCRVGDYLFRFDTYPWDAVNGHGDSCGELSVYFMGFDSNIEHVTFSRMASKRVPRSYTPYRSTYPGSVEDNPDRVTPENRLDKTYDEVGGLTDMGYMYHGQRIVAAKNGDNYQVCLNIHDVFIEFEFIPNSSAINIKSSLRHKYKTHTAAFVKSREDGPYDTMVTTAYYTLLDVYRRDSATGEWGRATTDSSNKNGMINEGVEGGGTWWKAGPMRVIANGTRFVCPAVDPGVTVPTQYRMGIKNSDLADLHMPDGFEAYDVYFSQDGCGYRLYVEDGVLKAEKVDSEEEQQ